jgi:hypothetical protein
MKTGREEMRKKIEQMNRRCDELAARHWRLGASDRELGYNLWLTEVKKVSHFIDVFKKDEQKNRIKRGYFFVNRLESANTNGSRREEGEKSRKSNEK